MDSLRQSEQYRGHTIWYAPARRRWLVQLQPRGAMAEFKAAFQARRGVNEKLDGSSEAWPRREP